MTIPVRYKARLSKIKTKCLKYKIQQMRWSMGWLLLRPGLAAWKSECKNIISKYRPQIWKEIKFEEMWDLENRFQKFSAQMTTISEGEKETDGKYTITIPVTKECFSEIKDCFLQNGKLH